jgi:CheY-like chemotaxis protein
VVDDSEINLLFLHGLLEHIGCQVATATNGFEALDLIDQHPYDLALIDINMPLMNGLELVKKIRELQIDLKIAVVSAYADEEKINEAYAAGIDAYLTKPVEENQLVELIQSSLLTL